MDYEYACINELDGQSVAERAQLSHDLLMSNKNATRMRMITLNRGIRYQYNDMRKYGNNAISGYGCRLIGVDATENGQIVTDPFNIIKWTVEHGINL